MPETPQPAPSSDRRRRLLGAALAWLVLSAGLLALYWFPQAKQLAGDEVSVYQPMALSVLAGGDWFDPRLLWPPLQGLFMAAVYALAGPHVLAVQLVQLALLVLSGVLLQRCCLLLTGDTRTADWAAIALVVNPATIAFATWLWPEIMHLFASLLLAWLLLARRGLTDARRATAVAGLAGAALGLCLLAKSLLAGFWPLLLVTLWQRRAPGRSLAALAAFGLGALLVTGPVVHRSWQETGRATIADSSWFNLWVGLGDRWRSDYVFDETGERMAEYLASADDASGRAAYAREQALGIVEAQGVVATLARQAGRQYFRLFDARTTLSAQLPGPACRGHIGLYSLRTPWLVSAVDHLARGWHLALLLMAGLGLLAWRDWRRPWIWLLLVFLGYQLALFGGLHVKTRFLVPMLPVLCLFAAHLLVRLGESAATTHAATALRGLWPGWRAPVAALAATALLVLSLAGPALDGACADHVPQPAGTSLSVASGAFERPVGHAGD
ncbi:MAG: hypothetical protein KF823_02785 [Xanthomonadales bacterium]|nr:hypothetical protein [Xanthomonadales bacterium]